MSQQRGQWGSKAGFVLAAAGSAVGLGNIWKFPYITGENGGGLFVLIYLVCILLVGVPILMAEIMIGRASQTHPILAFQKLQGRSTWWTAFGWLGLVTGFLIASFYIVVAGWTMDYTLKSLVGFTNPIHEQAEVEALHFKASTPLGEMKDMVIADIAKDNSEDALIQWKRQFAPSTWEKWNLYNAALANSPRGGRAASPRILLTDPEIAAAVKEVEGAIPQRNQIHDEARLAAEKEVSEIPDEEVRDLATTMKRREKIRSEVTQVFLGLLADGWTSAFWAAIFIFVTILIVARGVGAGIERACRVLMPLLILCIVLLVVYGFFQKGFGRALDFVFYPDPSNLKASGVLEALGHAFFTLSLGMGAMITYGSYQKSKQGLGSQAGWIAGLDTGIALMACLMMFPIIFSYDQDPGSGPGLVFMSMPLAFSEMGQFGMLLGILFFGLLVFAALTSAISLLEVVASYLIDAHGWNRAKAAWSMGGLIFVFGFITAFANSEDFAMESWLPGYGQNFFDTMDVLTSNWMLPIGGLFISIYAGWVMPVRLREAEISDMNGFTSGLWLFLVRFVAPILVIIVLLEKIGVINVDEFVFNMLN